MLGMLKQLADATMLIGHLRYATHGNPSDNITNHPHSCDGGWIVHNGVISNHRSLISRYRLCPVSECDSEVIGLLAERSDEKTQMGRLISSVELCEGGGLTVGGLWTRRRQLVMIRRGNPLHISETSAGWYMGSLAGGLPGKAADIKAFKDQSAVRFTQRGISVDIEKDSVRYPAGYKKYFEPPKTLNIPRTLLDAAEFDDEWWKRKPGSHNSQAKDATAVKGGATGAKESGEVDGDYRGG